MIVIHNAILHIINGISKTTAISNQPFSKDDEVAMEYISKHLDKSFNDQSLITGVFYESSLFRKQLDAFDSGFIDFVDFSTKIANRFQQLHPDDEESYSTDLILVDFTADGVAYMGLLEFRNTTGYTHNTVEEEGVLRNVLTQNHEILPSLSQRATSFALVQKASKAIHFRDKARKVEGEKVMLLPDDILECNYDASSKETIRKIATSVEAVAKEFGENSAVAIARAKNYIQENISAEEPLEVEEVSRYVFGEKPIMRNAFDEHRKSRQIEEVVALDERIAIKATMEHKIRTDTGIDITFPAEYAENPDFLQFIEGDDGAITIRINNVKDIINRT